MKTPPTEIKETPVSERKAKLTSSGHVYKDLARLADVSYSMVWKWMNGERVSAPCQRAFEILTRRAS